MNKGTPPDDRVTLVFDSGDVAFCDPYPGDGFYLRWHKRHVDDYADFEAEEASRLEVAPRFRSYAQWPESYRWCELPDRSGLSDASREFMRQTLGEDES